MRIGICDDVQLYHDQISECVMRFFSQKGMGEISISHFENGDELSRLLPELDVLFLDMEMPGMHGKDVGRIMKERYPDLIVFVVTSYLEYLDDAMRFHTFRYISKPIDENRLYRNLEDAYREHLRILNKKRANQLILDCGIQLSDIYMVEAYGHRTVIHSVEEVIESNKPMKWWIETLENTGFYRTHKGYLVNMNYVKCIRPTEVVMRNGEKAFLSRRCAMDFKQRYLGYLNSRN